MTQFGVRPWMGNTKFFPAIGPKPVTIAGGAPPIPPPNLVRAIERALNRDGPLSMKEIAEEVAEKHGLSSWEMMRRSDKNRGLVLARWETWSRCREETPHGWSAIARFFHHDHSTVLKGVARYQKLGLSGDVRRKGSA